MNILMMTNTFTPHIGGVARSVEAFSSAYRAKGHKVMVIAPVFEKMPENETDVVRIPSIQRFNGSDFSVVLPILGYISEAVKKFQPDIIHAHHPFLIGGSALRLSNLYELPLVFTHHTMYEQYTHYVPGDSQAMKKFAIKLSTSYANLCDMVFAPSESVAEVLRQRGVKVLIEVVPTGVDLDAFSIGSGPGFKEAMSIPADSFLLGYIGRLAPEKNLEFLAAAVADYMTIDKRAHFLVVGFGPAKDMVVSTFAQRNISDRLHIIHSLSHPLLSSAYQSLDVFVFASQSETQGMVLTEAMAAKVPVVAVDAPGVREVIEDRVNGILLSHESRPDFVAALQLLAHLQSAEMQRYKKAAGKTAMRFSMQTMASRALTLYEGVLTKEYVSRDEEYDTWKAIRRMINAEWEMLKNVF